MLASRSLRRQIIRDENHLFAKNNAFTNKLGDDSQRSL